MKSSTKWILGIGIGVVVLLMLFATGFLLMNRWHRAGGFLERQAVETWKGGRGDYGREMPMHPYRQMPLNRYTGFFPMGGLFGGILCLGFIGLLFLVIVGIVLSQRHPAQTSAAPAAPVVQPVQPAVAATRAPESPQPGLTMTNCPSCTQPVQEGWNHCPNCGSSLKSSEA